MWGFGSSFTGSTDSRPLSFETATGTRTIRAEDHQAIKPVIMYRVRGASNDDGFEVVDYRVVDGAEVIEPAAPGKPVAW